MLNRLKQKLNLNDKLVELIMAVVFGSIGSLYIIYKLSNSIFTVLVGFAFITIGLKSKDPEEEVGKVNNHVEQLTIFSEEVLEPSVIKEVKKKVSKKVKA